VSGIEFQSHSVTHRNIGNISDSDAYFELAQSKADIESHLGKTCIIIAWPHNSYSGYSRSILSEIGYRGAAEYGSGKSENTTTIKLYAIKRIPIYRQNPPSSYVSLLGLN